MQGRSENEIPSAADPGLKPLFAAALLFSSVANLLMLTGPLFMLQVYDRVIPARSDETLGALMLLVTGLFVAMASLDLARGRILTRIGTALQRHHDPLRLRSATLQRPVPVPPPADGLRRLLGSPVFGALLDLPWVPLFLVAIALFHPALGLLALVGCAVLIGLSALARMITRRDLATAETAANDTEAQFHLIASHAAQLRATGTLPGLSARWRAGRAGLLTAAERAADRAGAMAGAARSLRLYLQSAMLALGAWLVIRDQLGAGAMVASSILMGRALAPVDQILAQWPAVLSALSDWHRLRRARSAGTAARAPTVTLPRPEPRIAVRRLTVTPPGSDTPSLGPISFDIPPGSVLGVLGPSGAGKSTLALALAGAWPARDGEARLGGASLLQYGDDLGRHLGFLPQTPRLFPGTVAENIARMAMSPDSDAVIEAARRAGAHDLILGLPEGYDTRLGSAALRVSVGQAQRISLARALYGGPAILILDEPTASLDSTGARAVDGAIRDTCAAGGTVVLTTHKPGALGLCDSLLVLSAGRLRAFGPRDVVLRDIAPEIATPIPIMPGAVRA